MNSLKHILLPVAVFITGASILIVEVVGVRVLSPFYGNTIFTVSSVISVILLALSCGYYLGGKLADRYPALQYFFGLILVSGLVLLLFYCLGKVVLPSLSLRLSISVGPLVSAALLFLLPALLLGTLSPYAVKLQSVLFPEQGVGSVAGNIFFWSTLGSIAGSLSAGFLLIPRLGIDRILIANGVVLFVLGLVPLLFLGIARKRAYVSVISFALALGGAYFATRWAARPVLFTKDGVYQQITIYDGEYAGRPTRFFQQDQNSEGAGEGAMFLDSSDPTDLVYEYTRYYSLYKIFTPRVQNALVIGGGAYSVPKALLHDLPNATVDVVDIEPSLFGLAKRYFRVTESPRLHNYVEDGRRLLRDSDKTYDLIFSDAYYSFFSVPPHMGTKEFFAIARERLNPDGILVVNMIGDLSRQQPSLIMSEIKTFQTVFPNSYFIAVEWPERTDSQNIMLVGCKSDTRVDLGSAAIAASRDPIIRSLPFKVIDVAHRFELSPYPVLTDNFSPVEYLTAQVLRRAFSDRNPVDGNEMLAVVEQQMRYGPRPLGAPGHEKERNFLLAEMKLLAEDVKTQTWTHTTADGKAYQMSNIIGRFYGSAERRVVLATHYDSASFGAANATGLLSSANDASGVAVLVELARALGDSTVPPKVGIDMIFFDGAEAENGSPRRRPLGSEYFADHLSDLYGETKPVSAFVLDAVCRGDLRLLKEQSSVKSAAAQVDAFWNIGRTIDGRMFPNVTGPEFDGDQSPLIRAGIPSVLVADSEHLHSDAAGDARGKCSPRTLEAVGQALMNYATLTAQPSD